MGKTIYRRNSTIRKMKKARFRRSCKNLVMGMLAVALMSLFFILCHDIVIQSPYFRATTLEVSGNVRLSVDDVLKTAHIKPDENVLMINIPLATKYLLSNPWISFAQIRRELPGSIYITIKEHQALAVLNIGKKFLMDTDGNVFKEVSDSDPTDLPTIEGIDYSDLPIGDVGRSSSFNAVLSLLNIGKSNAAVLPNHQVQRIKVDRESGITIYTTQPIENVTVNAIFIGYQDYPEKFVRLKKIITYFKTSRQNQGIDWIDLHQMNRVVVSPLMTASSSPGSGDHKES